MSKSIDIVIKARDATAKAWKSVGAAASKLKSRMAASMSGIADIVKKAAIAIGLIGGAVLAAGKNLIGFASNAEEVDTKFSAVFRTTIKTARAISEDLASSFDLADSTAQQMLADTGDLLTGFGFTGEEALKMADKVNRLGIDLASFTNYSKGAAGASQALTKLLLGETEQAKSLGIVVRQGSDEYKNAVKAKQKDQGLSLLQAKATVALEMAYKQSTNAIGDYARTQEGVANRQRKASEAFKQAREELGAAIIAHSNYGNILNIVAEKTRELTESGLIELWAQKVHDAITLLTPSLDKVGKTFGKTFGWIKLGIQEASAFWGAVSAGSSLNDASQISIDTPKALEADRAKKLAAIKAERAAAKEAKAAKEAAKEAVEKQLESERMITDEKEKQAALAIETAKKSKESAEERLELEKQATSIHQTLNESAELKIHQGALDDAEKKIADIEPKLAEIARKKALSLSERKDERRAEQKALRAQEHDAARVDRLREKERKGGRLGRGEKDFLAEANLADKLKGAKDAAAIAKDNLEQRRILKEEQDRADMVASLKEIEKTLAKNLELA